MSLASPQSPTIGLADDRDRRERPGPRLALVGLGLAAMVPAAPAGAHEFSITDVLVVLRANATYQVDVRVDVDALALGMSPAADDAALVAALEAMDAAELEEARARARDTVARRVRVRFDNEKARPQVSFPAAETGVAGDEAIPTVLGTVARLAGRQPAGAETFSLSLSRAFGPVQLTLLDERYVTGTRVLLGPGERSPPGDSTVRRRTARRVAPSRAPSPATWRWGSSTSCRWAWTTSSSCSGCSCSPRDGGLCSGRSAPSRWPTR